MECLKEIILLCGFPASGKSTYANNLTRKDNERCIILSRDKLGGKIKDMIKKVDEVKHNYEKIIIDNTNINPESRGYFIEWAQENNIPINAVIFNTTLEDCQIRHFRRMMNDSNLRGESLFMGKSLSKDPHVFPISVLFKARSQWIPPTLSEGFNSIKTYNVPSPKFNYDNKAIFLDIDGTVRKYPIKNNVVEPLFDVDYMKHILNEKMEDDYILIGVSNQSGIQNIKSHITEEIVRQQMKDTQKLFDLDDDTFEIHWCKHKPGMITCFCRKPQIGIGVYCIEQYKLDPRKCIMVGDRKTDETFAKRLRMKFMKPEEFFK